MTPEKVMKLRQELGRHDQGHLLRFWEQIDAKEQQKLFDDLQSIDYEEVEQNFLRTKCDLDSIRNNKLKSGELDAIPDEAWGCSKATDKETRSAYRDAGLSAIGQGKVAVILLAGGQGTRLGSDKPKGMFDVGLPSGKTLYQLQAEKLVRLKRLAEKKSGTDASIPWYIMTSPATRSSTASFFCRQKHFGLPPEDVVFFEQGTLPCFDYDGRIILEEMHKVSRAPDGNGGLYRALQRSGCMADMLQRGVEFIHVYCVDNILVKLADPVFIGFCIGKGAECGAKVVEKVFPHESVGVFCRVKSRIQVVEYSEISAADAEKRRPDGKLVFNAGNICNHFFTLQFLNDVVKKHAPEMKFHIAQKKIPHVDPSSGLKVKPTRPNGIKLEKFVFDAFAFANEFVCWQVEREEEFSPLKNGDGAAKDTPTSCRNDLYNLHRQMIISAGGQVVDANRNFAESIGDANGVINGVTNGVINGVTTGKSADRCCPDDERICSKDVTDTKIQFLDELVCEISPLLTYDGEDMEDLVSGQTLVAPVCLELKSKNKTTNGTTTTTTTPNGNLS